MLSCSIDLEIADTSATLLLSFLAFFDATLERCFFSFFDLLLIPK